MEKITARFLTTVKPEKYIGGIIKNGVTYYYTEFDEETTERIWAEAAKYYVSKNSRTYYEDDIHNEVRGGNYNSGCELRNLTSISSPVRSTNIPDGDILVIGREFAGVVLHLFDESGGTWSYQKYDWYTFFYKDGTVEGSDKTIKCISLEDSSTDDEDYYYLLKK